MRYAVVMAGGAGRRLWPWSRLGRPKQLLPLLAGGNLLQLAVRRLEGLFEPANTWIITNASYAEAIRAALPDIPPGNVVGEPMGRDTANAIALAAELLGAGDEGGTMAVFTADQVVRPVECFAEAVRVALAAAEEHADSLVTFGVRPTWPHTGLGYIHCGEPLRSGARRVRGFKEKPNHQLARQYVDSGEHFWNSGMFVWTLRAIRKALAASLPASVAALDGLGAAARGGADVSKLLADIYPKLTKISIDYAVMEKADNALMVELPCEWLDVGSWPALEQVVGSDDEGNTLVAGQALLLDSSRNILASADGHLLAVMGMDDCVIIHSADATLVCPKSACERLKDLVGFIEERHGRKYT